MIFLIIILLAQELPRQGWQIRRPQPDCAAMRAEMERLRADNERLNALAGEWAAQLIAQATQLSRQNRELAAQLAAEASLRELWRHRAEQCGRVRDQYYSDLGLAYHEGYAPLREQYLAEHQARVECERSSAAASFTMELQPKHP
jgi:hypothetical protein